MERTAALSFVGLGYAFVYSVLSLAIPLLIATAIDSSIVDHRYPLAPLLVAIAVLSVLRAWVNYRRRYATSRVGVAIEARLRELLYEQYLRYPRPFYDRQPTGQVLSRATNDLYPVRYFIGWGLVQAVQSSMLIVGTGVLLALTNWQLALWSALPMPLIAIAARRFGGLVAPVSRAVQARKGDLTDAANEAVVGIEMVQAFGRGQIVRDRFGDRAAAIRAEMLRQARLESIYLPPIFYLPSLSVALVLFLGGRSVIQGTMSYGDLALFIQLLLQLVWPLESIGWILDLSQRALAAAGRTFSWLDQIPLLPEPSPAKARRRARDRPAVVAFDDVHFAYAEGAGGALRSEAPRRAGRGRRRVRADRCRKVDPAVARPSPVRPVPRRGYDRGNRPARDDARGGPQLGHGRHAATAPVHRDVAGEPARRLPRRQPNRDRARVPTSWCVDVPRPAARRPGHDHRRARHQPLRRPAPAGHARPRVALAGARGGARRSAVGRRHGG